VAMTLWSFLFGATGKVDPGPFGEPAAITLKRDGSICDCNKAAEALFGHHRDQLMSRPVAQLLPELADVEWIQKQQPNPQLRFLCRIGKQFEALGRDGTPFPCRITLVDLGNHIQCRLRLVIWRVASATAPTPDKAVPC